MRRNRSDLAFLIGGCFLIPLAAIGQMRPTSDTAAMLASPTLPPEGRKAIQTRIDTVHARFRATHGGLGPEQFGVQCCQITQIHGSGFTTLHDPWIYQAYSYLYPDGGSSPMSAPVLLPSGVEIEFLDLYYYDSDPVNNIRAQLIAYSGGGPGSGSPGIDILTTTTSGGDSGYWIRLLTGVRPLLYGQQ